MAGEFKTKNLVFPAYLRNDEYKSRCVTFYACQSKILDMTSMDDAREENSFTEELFESAANGSLAPYDSRNTLDGSVTLPFPNSLSDTQQHNWSAEEGLLAQVADAAIKTFLPKPKPLSDDQKTLRRRFWDNLIADPKKLWGAFNNALGTRTTIQDPGIFQTYGGSNPRNFTLAYTFIPMNQQEAQAIKEIILWFKYYSSPEYNLFGVTMTSPHIFMLHFAGNSHISEMYNMKKCVLTSMNVDYGSDGAFSVFQDGFPKQINVSLSFAEMRITYAQEYAGETIK